MADAEVQAVAPFYYLARLVCIEQLGFVAHWYNHLEGNVALVWFL